MSTIRCPQCKMVNWATALSCKRCAYFFQPAEVSAAAATVAARDTVALQSVPAQTAAVEQLAAETQYSPHFSRSAFEIPDNWTNNGQGGQSYNQNYNQTDHQSYNRNYHQPNYRQSFPANQKTGLAVASMIFGILGMVTAIFLVGILLAPIGLILGIVALVKARKKPKEYGGQGFAIAGVATGALISLFIPIVLAIAIPNLMAARRAANEGSAISAMQTLADAQTDYRKGAGRGSCADLKTLRASGEIDQDLGKGLKNGYTFMVVNYPLGGCEISAVPVSASHGDCAFYFSTDDSLIRTEKGGKRADKNSIPLGDEF